MRETNQTFKFELLKYMHASNCVFWEAYIDQ